MTEQNRDNPLKKESDFMSDANAPASVEKGGQTILVVDDEPPLLRLLAFLLMRQGYTVLTATNGEDALALVRERHPDLLVLDVMMPRMDGYAVVSAIRADPSIAETPIILLTARAQDDDINRGLASGADSYITKPFDPEQLSERIAGFMGVKVPEKSVGASPNT